MNRPSPGTQHHTYAGYLVWSSDYGDELIDGVLHVREPSAPSRLHQSFVGEMFSQVYLALKGGTCCAFVAPFEVRLPKTDEVDAQIDTVVQPDILIVCNPNKLDDSGMRGAPDYGSFVR